MTCEALTIDRQPLEDTIEQWRAEQDDVANGFHESLEALEAYQRHLDAWQQQLAAEREELTIEREQLASQKEQLSQERVQLDFDRRESDGQSDQVVKLREQLAEAREKIASLSTDLLARSEELRTIDNKRAEMATQLELLRAREQNLTEALEREQQHFVEQHTQWSDELQHMKELLDRQLNLTSEGQGRERSNDPVIGSIVAQFDKLRQQQALGRRIPLKK